ncbi:Putative anti-sigma factor antagonist [Streptomyces hundungensis]|uniref:Anti-sigma factor antagonist n=1 Tax=Streptomyces hundungensis TaxID=1077946 RepID=A0A387HSY0_9ACTN|nr:STAS domain-containing protein [Streptomyces hundungensis]AYG84847.1 Putative anti-sigma factor antagonist [Streptomyces hundungensis]
MKDPELSPQATDPLAGPSVDPPVRVFDGPDAVRVFGDLDIDSAQPLYSALREALDRSADGLLLDLRGVDFCDCSGLGALLRIRHRALAQGKFIRVRGARPQVDRLLTATHTWPLFSAAGHTHRRPGHRPLPDLRRSA